MPLSAGTHLGPYEILASIGAGGMGEVYRARDTRLGRNVAIKISNENFSERFEREARSIAALNHPNICQLFDVGPNYLVMELIEGEAPKGPMPVEEALKIAGQIADALEAAHERGIVHRDLKPANVKITHGGTVKLLDFGLAKTAEMPTVDVSISPTMTMSPTRAGMILGTAAYMAPEQARGKNVDRRADIWAFGVVLYEMLTGEKAFQGDTAAELLGAVIHKEPDLDRVPARLRRVVRLCLEKDPKQRLQSVADWRLLVDDAPESKASPPRRGMSMAWAVASLMAAIAGAALWMWLRPKAPEARGVVRLTAAVPPLNTGQPPALAISHDGSRMAFVSGPRYQIYVRRMDELEARALPGTEGSSVVFLSFSPDGEWISFMRNGSPNKLMKVALAGGAPQVLAEVHPLGTAPTQDWGWDDNILYSDNGALMRVPAAGGKAETLATPDPKKNEQSFQSAQLLPDGVHILLGIETVNASPGRSGKIVAFDPKTGEKKPLLERDAGYASYLPLGAGSKVGYLVYFMSSTGSLMAVPFDAGSLTVKGSPVPVVDGVLGYVTSPFPYLAFSDTGMLAYLAGAPGGSSLRTLVWVDRKGVEQALPAPPRYYNSLRISPDGRSVALMVTGGELGRDIWVYDLARGTSQRITTEEHANQPVWTPDGKRLLFFNDAGALLSVPADGSGAPLTLASRDGDPLVPGSVSPDGRTAIGHSYNGRELWSLTLPEGPANATAQEASMRPFLADSRSRKSAPVFSPDGHWVAYVSNESGRSEVYVAPFPGPGGRFIISTEGGSEPRWSRDGRELFYRNGNKMMAVDVQSGSTFRAGTPRLLFEGDYVSYDVSPDGRRFLMIKSSVGGSQLQGIE
jgi:Tol biopolymer transport system component